MNSLTAHLTAGAGHGRLPFRGDCPICRHQRLSGRPPTIAVPIGAHAGLVATAMAAATVLPATATANPQPPVGETAQAGETPEPPIEESDQAGDETAEPPTDEAPDLRNVLTDPDAGTDSDADDVSGEDPELQPAPPLPTEPPVEPTAPPAAPVAAPPPAAETPAPPPALPAEDLSQPQTDEAVTPPGPTQRGPERRDHQPSPHRSVDAPPGPTPPAPPVEPQPTPALHAASVSAPAAPPASSTEAISGRSYTVRPRDSLWSIAKRLLGPGASNGQVAGDVHRLWELNRDRIATGDPNLLHVGTRLQLK